MYIIIIRLNNDGMSTKFTKFQQESNKQDLLLTLAVKMHPQIEKFAKFQLFKAKIKPFYENCHKIQDHEFRLAVKKK